MDKIRKIYNQYFIFLVVFVSFIFGLFSGYVFFNKDLKSDGSAKELYEDVNSVIPSVLVKKINPYNISNKSPEKFFSTMQVALIKSIKDGNFSILEDLFKEYFDVEYAAKVSLGKLWYTLSNKDKERFLSVFSSYIAITYYGYVKEIIGHADDIVIQNVSLVLPENDIYKGKMIIVRNTEGNINVGFTIRKHKDSFKLIDFTAFRVSFSMSLRRLLKPYIQEGIIGATEFLEKENRLFAK